MPRKQQKGSQNMAYLFVKGSSSNDEVKVIEGITTSSLNITNNITETSATKDEVAQDNDGIVWQTNIDGNRSWSLSVEINAAENQTEVPTQEEILDLITGAEDTAIPIWYGKIVTKADKSKEFVGKKGEARIASYDQSDPIEGVSTISLSLTGNGELTKVTEEDWANVASFKAPSTLSGSAKL